MNNLYYCNKLAFLHDNGGAKIYHQTSVLGRRGYSGMNGVGGGGINVGHKTYQSRYRYSIIV